MHFILLKYIHNIIRYMCFYKNRLNLPRSPLLMLFLDLSAAFDTLNHKIIIYMYTKANREWIFWESFRLVKIVHF